MRRGLARLRHALAAGAALAVIASSTPASAQVTMDNSALDALRAPSQAPRPLPTPRPAPRPSSRPAPARKPADDAAASVNGPVSRPVTMPAGPPAPAAVKPSVTAAKPAKPAIPAAPPAIAALPPAVVVPLAHPPPLPPVNVVDDAPGAAKPIAGGLRVTFGTDRADLNPATVAALRDFAHRQAEQPQGSINIYAYATGRPEDPSTPRRLSLERALAARAVLMKEGIPSPLIYPRALGPTGGSTDPDRVDVTTGSPTPPAPGGAG